MAADFHTGTGERLQITPVPQLKIDLDTQSSLRRRAAADGEGFELVQGQAAIETRAGLPAYLDWIRAQTREDTD
ncbi:hypothetical protein G6F60_015771 [Rhizopus arrhizus]|nr:hypothetical protein G6F60_015771 [Rhizopus arrhizus]